MKMVIGFLGGLGLFIFGMNIMAQGLQEVAGSKMKKLLAVLTKNKLMSVLVGALVTGIIQSSSAVTVMVVGFVNAGLMNLYQSVGVIMGANIGTTVTSWLVSSMEWSQFFTPTNFAPLAIAIGAILVTFCKKDKPKQIGSIIIGFGVLFFGINEMTDAAAPLTQSEIVRNSFLKMGSDPLLGVLTGACVTAIIQSSSASVGILQSLAALGLVPWNSAVYIIMGQNIGTCVTALLSGIGASKNAKATAYVHLVFNLIGTILFSIFVFIFFGFLNKDLGFEAINLTQISLVHTIFNVSTTLLLYPFSNYIIKIAQFLVGNRNSNYISDSSAHLDDRILETSSFALQSCKKEVVRLGYLSYNNLVLSFDALIHQNEKQISKAFEAEKEIDELSQSITTYLVKLCNMKISEEENLLLTSLFHAVDDIERIGDHSENIAGISKFMISEGISFSNKILEEIQGIYDITLSSCKNCLQAMQNDDMDSVQKVFKNEQEVDDLEQNLRMNYIHHLANNESNLESSVAFLDVLTNLERISDHALNIAQYVVKYAEGNNKN